MILSICQTAICVKERQIVDKLVEEAITSNVFNMFDTAVITSESFFDYAKNKGRRNYYVKKSVKNNQTVYETRKFIQDNRRRCPECITYFDIIHTYCPCCRLPLKKAYYEKKKEC